MVSRGGFDREENEIEKRDKRILVRGGMFTKSTIGGGRVEWSRRAEWKVRCTTYDTDHVSQTTELLLIEERHKSRSESRLQRREGKNKKWKEKM